ncbi:hypothetical protein WDU94_010615 [Cyamophila willieti]
MFSKAHTQVTEKCYREAKQMYVSIFAVVSLVNVGILSQSIIPMPQSELDIRRDVYRTKHVERRLPCDVRIPFIDESVSWAYEIVFVYQLYMLTYFTVSAATGLSLMPVTMLHLRGQYEILCKYITLIGEEHKDAAGNAIYYNNIEENHYNFLKKDAPFPKELVITRAQLIQMAKEKIRRKERYEAEYMRQIVRFHQRLLFVQYKSASSSPLHLLLVQNIRFHSYSYVY